MKAIVAVDENYGIGKNNELLFHIPDDLKFFKQTTLNKIVVMGRKTFTSLPNSKPLADRTNIVLTRDTEFENGYDNVITCKSIEDLLEKLKEYDTNDVFVIGGGKVYKKLLPLCDTIIMTKVKAEKDADVYFPYIERKKEWILAEATGRNSYKGIEYQYCTYIRYDKSMRINFKQTV